MKKIALFAAALLFLQSSFAQKDLVPADEESSVEFTVKNFGMKKTGSLTGLKGSIKFDPGNILHWYFDVTVAAATINTSNSTRDGHLRKPDYFDVARYPVIRIVSSKVEVTGTPGLYKFNGSLTIKGVSKPIQFLFKVNRQKDGYLFSGDFNINRLDYGVGSSSISLSDNVNVSLKVFAK